MSGDLFTVVLMTGVVATLDNACIGVSVLSTALCRLVALKVMK